MGSRLAEPAVFEIGTDGPRAIVVGVDDTPTSMRALAFAAGQARRQRARLIAVYVRDLMAFGEVFDRSGAVAEARQEARDEVERFLRAEVDRLTRGWKVDIRLVVLTGDPLARLTEIADHEHVDAIVVGASAHVAHRLAGSLAVRLVRRCGWPVTVVP
jgi:nucleotide-binding universal stress UspA family protein